MTAPLLFAAVLLHPFHFTSAEVEWNPKTSRLEVALRVSGNDLEHEIQRDTERSITIGSQMTPSDQKRLARYVERHFYLAASSDAKPGQGETSRLKWVGTEDDAGWTWLYFELIPPENAGNLWLSNRLFLEMHPTHINYVSFLSAGKRQTLQCSRGNLVVRCPLESDAPRE